MVIAKNGYTRSFLSQKTGTLRNQRVKNVPHEPRDWLKTVIQFGGETARYARKKSMLCVGFNRFLLIACLQLVRLPHRCCRGYSCSSFIFFQARSLLAFGVFYLTNMRTRYHIVQYTPSLHAYMYVRIISCIVSIRIKHAPTK